MGILPTKNTSSQRSVPIVVSAFRFTQMHTRLAETMDFVEEQRRSLLESFHGVPIERLSRRAGTDGWSVAEILDHLQIVESGVARLIAKRVAKAREAGLGDETSTASV